MTFKLGLFRIKHGTQQYSVCFIFLKWLELETVIICLILSAKMHFKVNKAFLALTRLKSLKLGLFSMKLGTQHYLVCIIVLKWLELKTIVICLELHAKLQFLAF